MGEWCFCGGLIDSDDRISCRADPATAHHAECTERCRACLEVD